MKSTLALALALLSTPVFAQKKHVHSSTCSHAGVEDADHRHSSGCAHEQMKRLLKDFDTLQTDVIRCDPPRVTDDLDPESRLLAEKKWFAGAQDCSKKEARTPPFEVQRVNATTFVLRQNKCLNFEAPFVYLYIGQEKAFLFDTGATSDASVMPMRKWVDEMLKGKNVDLVVAHSHSHGDHVEGDEQFRDRPRTKVIGYSPQEVASAFGIKNWPDGEGSIDLGGRKLSVIPIPGHEPSSIAVYDHNSGDLLSGDTIYPGNIFLSPSNYGEFRDSITRLHKFSQTHKIRNILGAHVEMSNEPGKDFPYGSTYQPNEHRLPLRQENLDELKKYIDEHPEPKRKVFNDVIIALPE